MSLEKWTTVDNYYSDLLVGNDPILDAALAASDAAGLPPHHVAPNQGKLLLLLAQIHGANRILEVGTLAGYSTIWLARALPDDGQVISLEYDPKHAEVAAHNIDRAGLSHLVEIKIGRAVDTMQALVDADAVPFDLIFIDADKPSNPQYFELALQLSLPGTVIIADNIIRDGEVINPDSDDPRVQGVRQFNAMIAAESRVSATAIQTVGEKGYDGFGLIRVLR